MRRVYDVQERQGEYVVVTGPGQTGNMSIHEARREAKRRNAQPTQAQPEPGTEITSGLGIGGIGSDDYDIYTELPTNTLPARSSNRLVRARCGHMTAFPMTTANGNACPDCYDRMSN